MDAAPLVTLFQGLVSCYRGHPSANGFSEGRGTYKLRSHFAGAAQDFPELTAQIDLLCPPPEQVGKCNDGGADAAADAVHPDVDDVDANVADIVRTDVTRADALDVEDSDAPPVPTDASTDALDAQTSDSGASETRDATAPPPDRAAPQPDVATPPSAERDDGGCSVRSMGDSSSNHGGWLLGALVLFAATFRRRSDER